MSRNATPMKAKPAAKPGKRPSGAKASNNSLADRFHSWRLHHRDSAKDALKRLRQSPFSSLMTILVIAIALALPTGLSLLLDNARGLTNSWDGNAHISVFLHQDVDETQQRALAQRWLSKGNVNQTEVITREQALAEYKALSGFGDALDALPDNPLPPVITVFPKDSSPLALEQLSKQLAQSDNVDLVQLDIEWIRRLHAMIELGERVISSLALALALAVVLVVINTIRLAIESRRDEIVIIKIVGGTDGFVRRPFLYTGFWFGFFGGLAATVLVQIALLWIGEPINQLITLYQSDFQLTGLQFEAVITLPIFAGLLGLFGSWLAVGKHLNDIQPQAF